MLRRDSCSPSRLFVVVFSVSCLLDVLMSSVFPVRFFFSFLSALYPPAPQQLHHVMNNLGRSNNCWKSRKVSVSRAIFYFLSPFSIFCRRPVESLFCTRKGAWMLLNLSALPDVTPAPRPRSLPLLTTLLLRLLLFWCVMGFDEPWLYDCARGCGAGIGGGGARFCRHVYDS